MKNLYSLVCMALLSLASVCAYADTNIVVNVDDVTRVQVENGYGNVVQDLQNGDNSLTVPQYGSVYIRAKEGAILMNCTKNGNAQSMSGCYSQMSLYISESDANAVFAITSAMQEEVRTGSCTIKVDDPSKVGVSLDGTYQQLSLTAGENVVKYIPSIETQVMISAQYPNTIYRVTVDGQVQTASYGSYYVSLSDGKYIDIEANYPDVKLPVLFSYADEAAKGLVKTVTVDNNAVENYNEEGFTVQAGSKLNITLNNTDYKLDTFKLNGVVTPVYGNTLSYTVSDTLSLYFAAHKYGNVTATLNVDNYDNIVIYRGYDQSNLVEVKENTISVSENDNQVRFAAKSGCSILTFTLNGVAQSAGYDGVYSVSIAEGDQIAITTYAIVRDQEATVILKDSAMANYGFYFQRADRSNVTLCEGENKVMFSAVADTAFQVAAYGSELSKMVVYLNGTQLAPYYEGGTSYNGIHLHNGDLLEIYLNGGSSTGISTLSDEMHNAVIFDLTGKRVNAAAKGLVIRNGKKCLMR